MPLTTPQIWQLIMDFDGLHNQCAFKKSNPAVKRITFRMQCYKFGIHKIAFMVCTIPLVHEKMLVMDNTWVSFHRAFFNFITSAAFTPVGHVFAPVEWAHSSLQNLQNLFH